VALLIALSGTAYAATIAPRNSVKSSSIVDGQVRAPDVGSNAVTATKIKDGAVTADKVAQGSVDSGKVLDGSLTGADIAPIESPPTRFRHPRTRDGTTRPRTSLVS